MKKDFLDSHSQRFGHLMKQTDSVWSLHRSPTWLEPPVGQGPCILLIVLSTLTQYLALALLFLSKNVE